MDEKLKKYEEKMTKTVDNLNRQQSGQDVPIRMDWTS